IKSPYNEAMLNEHIGESWYMKKEYPNALKHYTTAYDIFEKLNNKADLAFESFSIGKTLTKMDRFGEAEKYLLQSYTLNDTLKMLNYQADASLELVELYKTTKNWQKAFEYSQKAGEL